MAFNKISLLSVENKPISTVNIQYVPTTLGSNTSASNAKDILYHLGTNLNTQTWSNPFASSLLNLTSTSAGDIKNIISRASNTYTVSSTTYPLIITFEFLTGFQVDLQAFRYKWNSGNSFALDTFNWEGSNDGTNWEVIYSANELQELSGTSEQFYYKPILDNRPGYFSQLRLNIKEGSNQFRLEEIELYGKLRNLTTGVAGYKTPGDRFDNLLNVDAYNPRINREIIFDANENVWESHINQPWTVVSKVLDGSLTLTRDDLRNPRFYILNPNGSSKDIYLPTPEINDAIKFRNIDGMFDINIYEEGSSTPVVLSNAGKVQYEYVYDGTEWHVLG